MSSRAHSFRRLENRLRGPGAAASLVCQIPSCNLEPALPKLIPRQDLCIRRHISMGTHVGTRHLTVQRHMQACTYPSLSAFEQLHACAGTLDLRTRYSIARVCIQTYLCIYIHSHRSGYICMSKHICTPLHTYKYTYVNLQRKCKQVAFVVIETQSHTGSHSRA